MKLQAIKRFPRTACLVLAAALVPWYAGADPVLPASPSSPLPPVPPTVSVPASASKLSPSAREVLKLVNAGVPEDVVKAYVQSSSSMFTLSPDNIVELHNAGVSGGITTEMISHDTAYRNNAAAMAAVPPQTQAPQAPAYPQPQVPDQNAATAAPDYTQGYYNDLAPYGTWSYVPNYGWGWQAYPTLDSAYYPWPVLGLGLWNWCPGTGWCWFPREHFRGFDRFHGGFDRVHGFAGGNRFGTFNHTFNNNFNRFGGFNHFNSGVVNRAPMGGFHSFGSMGSVGHFSGGTHFTGGGGTHFAGGGGAHFSGGGAHFSGGGGHSGGFGGHR